MACELCLKVEKQADSGCDYICSSCMAKLSTMNKDQIRYYIDKLYLANKVEKAEFLERIMTGRVGSGGAPKTKLKVRVVAYKYLKPSIQ